MRKEEPTSTSRKPAIAPVEKPNPRWKFWLFWVACAAAAVPVGLILHELGHHAFALAFGFRGSSLHYFSANYAMEQVVLGYMARGDRAGASSIYPLWQIAINAIAGPAVGYFLMLPACLLALKHKPHPFLLSLAAMPLLRAILETPVAVFSPQMLDDENTAAFAMGLPPTVLQVLGLLISLAAFVWLVRRIPADRRGASMASMVLGIIAGLVIYIGFLGPWLLP